MARGGGEEPSPYPRSDDVGSGSEGEAESITWRSLFDHVEIIVGSIRCCGGGGSGGSEQRQGGGSLVQEGAICRRAAPPCEWRRQGKASSAKWKSVMSC
jgi:hypothetical protein